MLGRGVGRIRGAESVLHGIDCADGLVWYETGSNGVLERRKVLLWSMGLGKVEELVKLGVLERGS